MAGGWRLAGRRLAAAARPEARARGRARRMGTLLLAELEGKGRGLLAERPLAPGDVLLRCTPIAKVVKAASGSHATCRHCLAPLESPSGREFCSQTCALEHQACGGDLLDRCDLSELQSIHAEQGRKFPLLVAQLLAALLAGLRDTGTPPLAWQHALALCHAVLPPEASSQVRAWLSFAATKHPQIQWLLHLGP